MRQAELFEEMEEKDCHLASVLQTRRLAVAGLDWLVQAYSENARDQEISAFCDEQLRTIDGFEYAMTDLLDAIGKGYSACEIIWGIRSKKAVVERLAWIHPKRISFWNSVTPRILTDEDRIRGIEPPPWKLIFHRYRARSGHDTRAGVLRACAWMYLFKNYAIKDWAIFSEVFGMPLRLGKYEPSASQADRDALVTALRSLGTDAAGIISKSTEIEFVEASQRLSGTSNPYETLVNFCNREISKAVLGQTLTTDTSGTTGTYSAGKVHNLVRLDILKADSLALANTLRTQLLTPLVGFNFGWDHHVPYIIFDVKEDEDMKAVAEAHEILGRMGFPMSLEYLSDRFGIPLPEAGQQLIVDQKTQKTHEEGPNSRGSGGGPDDENLLSKTILPLRSWGAMAITRHDKPVIQAQQELEALTQHALQASAAAAAKMLVPVQELIKSGADLEVIKTALLDVYGDLETQDLEEALYQAAVLAELRGRLEGNGP